VSVVTVLHRDGGVHFRVRVQPRASRSEFAGTYQESVKVRLQAPPIDGAANAALVLFLAQALGVPRRMVRIAAETSSRTTVVEVDGGDGVAVERLITEV